MRALIALSWLGVTLGCLTSGPDMGTGPYPTYGPSPGPGPSPTPEPKKMKPFLFGVEGAWPPYSYQDPKSGKAIGFFHDVVHAACDGCGKLCDVIFIGTNLDRCFNAKDMSGDGLSDRHFDACIGWTATVQRWNVFNLSVPLVIAQKAQIYVKPSSSISLESIPGSSAKIGFRKYWYMDKFCIRHSGLDVSEEQVVEVEAESDGWADLAKALKEGEIDAAVMPDNHPVATEEGLVPLGKPIECNYGGQIGLMHRKDVDTAWFDSCLSQMQFSTNRWNELCSEWEVPNCVDPYQL